MRSNCLELWNRTHDLRIAAYLTLASVCLDGLDGLNNGLKIIKHLVTEEWDYFWPRIDPQDDNDPTERVNILAMLSPHPGSFSDPIMFLSRLRELRLVDGFSYSLRDLMIANGELGAEDSTLNVQLFNGEMSSVPIDLMGSNLAVINEIISNLSEIESIVSEKTNGEAMVSFASLETILKTLCNFYKQHSATPSDGEQPVSDNDPSSLQGATNQATNTGRAFSGSINDYKPSTRGEALLLIRKSAEYFRAAEPTNPVPYLLERALRISEMNFVDLLADITPDSVGRIKEQLGIIRDTE